MTEMTCSDDKINSSKHDFIFIIRRWNYSDKRLLTFLKNWPQWLADQRDKGRWPRNARRTFVRK